MFDPTEIVPHSSTAQLGILRHHGGGVQFKQTGSRHASVTAVVMLELATAGTCSVR